MIEWIFFDVGNVLVDDAPQDFQAMRIFHDAIARKSPEYTFRDMLNEREEMGQQGPRLILAEIAAQHLTPEEIREVYLHARHEIYSAYETHNLPIAGVEEVLVDLGSRYKLGLIANQPIQCREVLQQRGLLKHFGVVAISDELGMRKPDPAIFRWALEQAGTSPSHAVMVGDRRDNDIVPAGMLGMKTLWLCWRSHQDRTWRPEDPQQRLFLESCDRVAYFGRSDHLKPDPDGTVHDWASLPGAIADLVT